MSQDQPDYAQMRKDEHVRDLFAWIKRREAHGAKVGDIIKEMGTPQWKQDHPLEVSVHVGALGCEITCVDLRLVIRHDGTTWQPPA
jgi:hypothetical protein